MPEEKLTLVNKIFLWIVSYPWLKLISLVLAILLWFYAKGEVEKFN